MKNLKLIAILMVCLTSILNAQTHDSIFITSTGTWTVPCGVTSVTVQCWGAGGGGEGGSGGYGSGGGAGGGYSINTAVSVTPNYTYTVTVGVGGAGGRYHASYNIACNGYKGGNSSFGIVVIAHGGDSAGGGNAGTHGGLDTYNGGSGYGYPSSLEGGGGGGGAGSNSNGTTATSTTGGAGGLQYGGKGGNGSLSAGTSGSIYGAGGAGGGSGYNGGAGANGLVIIRWIIPVPLIVTPVVLSNIGCFGGNDGSGSVSVSGGATPYIYSWIGGGTNATESGLTAGTYTVNVTDLYGCSASTSIIITQPLALSASMLNDSTVSVSGGTAPYTYLWTPSGATTTTATGLSAGTYTVLVTDVNGCNTSIIDTVHKNVTGINYVMNDKKSFNVYPNPSNGNLTIELENSSDNVKVYDMLGRQVFYSPLPAGHNLLSINAKPGMYFINVDGCSQKIIIQ